MKLAVFSILFLVTLSVSLAQPNSPDRFPINAIDSDDFSDLKSIDALIKDKRLVLLGESQHGVNDFNVLKFRIIRYLHQHHGFDVVAFETGIGNSGLTNLVKDSLSGMEILVRSLMGIWRVKGNCDLMTYMRDQQMQLAGFDPNTTSLGLTTKQYIQILGNVTLAKRFARADSLMLYSYRGAKDKWKFNNIPFSKPTMDSLQNHLKQEFKALLTAATTSPGIEPRPKEAIRKSIEATLQQLSTSLNKKDDDYYVDGLKRDQLMAANLQYLADTRYKDKKIIVWAHNAHIAKTGTPGYNFGTSTFLHLPQRLKDQSTVIGLFVVSGQYAWGNNPPQSFTPAKGSLESTFSNFDSKALCLSTHNMDRTKMNQGIPAFKSITPDLYDAIILVKDTQAAQLIRFNKTFACE